MRVHDARYLTDARRHELALRLLHHEVRTRTVRAWTGLSDDRVRRLCRTFQADETGALSHRHRGPSPQSLMRILRKAQLRAEAAAAAGLCRAHSVIPAACAPDAARDIPGLARGERLCATFETYRAALPNGTLSLEHLICLVIALSQGDEITLGACRTCGATILVDRLALERLLCLSCQSLAGTHHEALALPPVGVRVIPGNDEPLRGYQWSLF